ncbi:MAG: maltose alpha-D-glucosyltransferase [Bacteroidota bacterium]
MAKDSLWYKDAVIYEIHLRAFFDSNADGIGDFTGLIRKLDYLEDLGVNTLWLLPFYPSPLKDDGYDVTNYVDIHADYGTLTDFKKFLKRAHELDMRVIIELALNHTSDQHPWFQQSRKSRNGSKWRSFYVWNDQPDKFEEARVIFSDYENSNWSWDPVAKSYYWHRFYHHMPDLNYDSPDVQLEITKVVDFWLKMGVDGLRLASVPYLFEREGTNCENLPETHDFLRKLRKHVNKKYPESILLAEANLWPEEAASYFGDGKECHMAVHYPLMPRLFMAMHTEDNHPIVDIIDQTPDAPENGQWALFLRNHDSVGLEMVTEEEKDYLYKAYASDPNTKHNIGIHRRLAPMLDNDRRKIELMYTLLFSLPGSPIIYYGDEIGMGDNVFLGDRHGVRTPMQWNSNMNAGFSKANPQQLYLPVITDPVYRYEAVSVAVQQNNLSSLQWWIKNTIAMRKRFKAFSRGNITFLESTNSKILAYAREYEGERLIVVANLSKYSQASAIDLGNFSGSSLTEVFSQNVFPKVDQSEYPVTIGPYGYFWFYVEEKVAEAENESEGLKLIKAESNWDKFFSNFHDVNTLENQVLSGFLKKTRWFGGKAKKMSKIKVDMAVPMKVDSQTVYLMLLEVCYIQRLPEYYFMPLSFIPAVDVMEEIDYNPQSVVCRIDFGKLQGFLIDSSYDTKFRDYLLFAMSSKIKVKTDHGELSFNSGTFNKINLPKRDIRSKVLKADQSNTAIIYNDRYFFKFYRKIEKEINPDLEIVRFLSEKTAFANAPKYAGGIEFKTSEGESIVFGLLQSMVENQGDAWVMTTDALGRYFDRVFTRVEKTDKPPKMSQNPVLDYKQSPELIQELIGNIYVERVVKLAQRTAEMHLALASDDMDEAFAPEKISGNYQRAVYSSLRKLVKDRFKLLAQKVKELPPNIQILADEILGREKDVLDCFSEFHKNKIEGIKTRIHGDYHLGQVLFNGKDFIIIDFEGEPGFTFSERRLKKSPVKDVAGMMRSFHYAAYGKILLNENYRDKDIEYLETWAEQWQHYISRFYLSAYMERMGIGKKLTESYDILMRTYLLEKAIYELGYELNSRPDWVIIPLRGIKYLIDRYDKTK